MGKTQDVAEEKDRITFGDRPKNGDDSEPRYHERRHTQTNGRYGNRQDSEEPEAEARRDFDRRPKWGRDRNEQEQENDQLGEESTRSARRDTQSRAKLSQSWFRKETGDAEDDKALDWRRDRGRDREWDRGRATGLEAEPEWMDSTEPEEPFQVPRTQEDFQRWKERMKAGGSAPLEKIETSVPSPPAEEKQPSKRVVSVEADDSMDKFFAKFESKTAEQKSATVKVHGKTRFASLFSPATEQNKQIEFPAPMLPSERPSSAQAAGPSTEADQAGFARILEMLQTRSNNPTPQSQETTKPRTPLYARSAEARPENEATLSHNNLISLLAADNKPAPKQPLEQGQPLPPPQRSTDNESPISQPTHTRQQSSINKDEVLLNLLRQANLAPKPQPPPAGMFAGIPDQAVRPMASRGTMISPIQAEQDPRRMGPRMFDESPLSMYPNDQAPREQGVRRPTNGTQPTYPEDALIAMLRGQGPQQRQAQPPQGVPQGYPPGLQRPPGLDQGLRGNPSWPAQQPQPQQQQQQPPRQPPMPPGLANIPRGMPGVPYGQPQQIPTQQPQPQRPQPPQRKYTAESGMPPNFPPGMYPPPGFMNAGPPPGFPGGMVNHPAARIGGDPVSQQRAFLEMYDGDVGRRGMGLRGGAGSGGMPPYR